MGILETRKRPFDPNIGKRIAIVRKAAKLTQQQLGTLVGVSRNIVRDYERGHSAVPIGRLPDFARALKCKPTDFLRDPGAPLPRRQRARGSAASLESGDKGRGIKADGTGKRQKFNDVDALLTSFDAMDFCLRDPHYLGNAPLRQFRLRALRTKRIS